MKRQFVIDCDTAYHTVAVYEVTKEITADGVEYKRDTEESIFNEFLGPKFYGKLDAILISRDRLENAKPIDPEMPANRIDQAISEAEQAADKSMKAALGGFPDVNTQRAHYSGNE